MFTEGNGSNWLSSRGFDDRHRALNPHRHPVKFCDRRKQNSNGHGRFAEYGMKYPRNEICTEQLSREGHQVTRKGEREVTDVAIRLGSLYFC